MIKREIEISGKKVPFRSSATIPRLYRAKFKRDIFKDLSKLEKSYKGKTENGEELQIEDLEIFENVAYVILLPWRKTSGNATPRLQKPRSRSIYPSGKNSFPARKWRRSRRILKPALPRTAQKSGWISRRLRMKSRKMSPRTSCFWRSISGLKVL